MEVTNRQIAGGVEAMAELLQLDLPAIVSFRVGKILNILSPVSKAIETTRKTLLHKYAKRDESGQIMCLKDERGTRVDLADQDAFEEEFGKVLNVTNEVDISPIKIGELAEVKVKPIVFVQLDWLFEG